MKRQLLNITMHDGSRHFGDLPRALLWHELAVHIDLLEGARVTGLITDGVTEGWIDFSYRDYEFSVNDQFGEYWFFVSDPSCPDRVLQRVLCHCGSLLTRGACGKKSG